MNIFHFNTNIKCADCQQKVAETFNKERRIISFKVDFKNSNRPIEVSCTDSMTEVDVQALIQQAGYQAQPIEASGYLKSAFTR